MTEAVAAADHVIYHLFPILSLLPPKSIIFDPGQGSRIWYKIA